MQLRRWWPTALIQGGQRLVHRVVLGRALADPAAALAATAAPATPASTAPAGMDDRRRPAARAADTLPLPLRLLQRFPVLQGIPARLVAIGPLPEHAPDWARRTAAPGRRRRLDALTGHAFAAPRRVSA